MKKIRMSAALLLSMTATAQDTTSNTKHQTPNSLTFSGYVEGYYSYDLNKPENNTRPGFLYNFNRHNEFAVNLAFVKGGYATERVRANLAIGVGTYMNANYAAESGTIKNSYEANAGYKLSAKNNLWLDIGVLPSHMGFESAVGKDNWTLTRSMLAENSPYFQGGARLSYTTDNAKLLVSGYVLNGWQRITRVEGNSLLSYGTQVYFKPSTKVTLNYSTFLGTDKPDAARLWRYFHNLYGVFQFTDKVGFTAGFDFGSEQKAVNSDDNNTWYSPVGILRITSSPKWAIALRGEYYNDENGVIISTGTPNGFKTSSGSINIDYLPQPKVALRLEGRTFNSKDDIFVKGGGMKNNNTAISFSTAISF
ncbi:MAG: porin [Flavisolibacter sp.]|nr:porin [Flavisolibacter sp.]